MKYVIWERYEWRSSQGIVWTQWFREFTSPITDTKEELKDKLKECVKNGKWVSSKTGGLKHEYKIDEYIEPPKIEKKKRGRPKKKVEE